MRPAMPLHECVSFRAEPACPARTAFHEYWIFKELNISGGKMNIGKLRGRSRSPTLRAFGIRQG